MKKLLPVFVLGAAILAVMLEITLSILIPDTSHGRISIIAGMFIGIVWMSVLLQFIK